MASETLSLKRVFSPPLNQEKHWYALNSPLCCSKPAFCSTSTLYWLAKEEMANKKFLLLFTLLQMLGLENMTHFHHRSAGVLKQRVVEALRESKAFGLLVDEVMDISPMEQLIGFAQYDGEAMVKFLFVDNVFEDSSSANA
ncbi:hypothetical protein P5673_005675 [Acropora cervicornis]|uniref:Uncharacterized protein n=1 Tax=Acropora cervicornis TaxID=6130 RepID=A0AAD9VD09_ACRCE|nr:hypothetical protein P5673_005675 [Acropora cervicornis]